MDGKKGEKKWHSHKKKIKKIIKRSKKTVSVSVEKPCMYFFLFFFFWNISPTSKARGGGQGPRSGVLWSIKGHGTTPRLHPSTTDRGLVGGARQGGRGVGKRPKWGHRNWRRRLRLSNSPVSEEGRLASSASDCVCVRGPPFPSILPSHPTIHPPASGPRDCDARR